jgi:hypothetical protein
MAESWDDLHKPVGTWLSLKDFELLRQLAQANNVGVAAYVRAIIVDALQDELYINQNSINSTIQHTAKIQA